MAEREDIFGASGKRLKTLKEYEEYLKGIESRLKSIEALEDKGLESAISKKETKEEELKVRQRIASIQSDSANLEKNISNIGKSLANQLYRAATGGENLTKALETVNEEDAEKLIQSANAFSNLVASVASGDSGYQEILEAMATTDFGDFSKSAEKLAQTMKDMPYLQDIFKVTSGLFSKLDDATGGLLSTLKGLGKAVMATGPIGLLVALAGILVTKFISFAKQSLEIRRNLGVSVGNAARLSFHMEKAALAAKLQGGDAQKTKDLVTALAEEFGTVQEATSLSAKNTADLATNLGAQSGDIAKVLKVMSDLSGESLNTLSSQLEFEASLSKAAGIPMSKVMSQIASNTALFARYGAAGADEMFRAARFAADLGTNLATVEGIADSILDIESSLAAQMEAEMLIGRELNLDRARQLAQQNDLEGLTREIQGLVGGPEAFANLGRIEQNALANALGGISIQQLTPFMAGNTAGGTNQVEQEQIGTAKDQLAAQNQTNKILNEKLDLLIEATDKNTKEQKRSIVG